MDLDDLVKYSELIYNIFAILAFGSIIWGFYSYTVNKKQLYGTTMSRCIDIYREQFIPSKLAGHEHLASDYIDFVNEELFYFEKKFIPKDIMIEWMDGMLNHVPIFKEGKIMNGTYCFYKITEDDLSDYPRVRKAFNIKKKYDFDTIYSTDYTQREKRRKERDQLIKEIVANVQKEKKKFPFIPV